MEIGEKSKVGLSPDSHNAWEPAQDAGFHIPPATAAAGTMKVNTAEPLESRGCSDSCTEPTFQGNPNQLAASAHFCFRKQLLERVLRNAFGDV